MLQGPTSKRERAWLGNIGPGYHDITSKECDTRKKEIKKIQSQYATCTRAWWFFLSLSLSHIHAHKLAYKSFYATIQFPNPITQGHWLRNSGSHPIIDVVPPCFHINHRAVCSVITDFDVRQSASLGTLQSFFFFTKQCGLMSQIPFIYTVRPQALHTHTPDIGL